MCRLSWNLGASTFWNPQGLSRPVQGCFTFTLLSDIYMGVHMTFRIWISYIDFQKLKYQISWKSVVPYLNFLYRFSKTQISNFMEIRRSEFEFPIQIFKNSNIKFHENPSFRIWISYTDFQNSNIKFHENPSFRIWISYTDFQNSNIKFHENPSSGCRVVPCQMDRQTGITKLRS